MTGMSDEITAAIEHFDKTCDAAIANFAKELDARKPPPIIYHYTDDIGLKGILESGAIRLTSVANLNDPTELKHGFSHAVDILRARVPTGPPELETFSKMFDRFLINGGIDEAAHYFVTCFSTSPDDLGQWRAYADNGRGFAVGFDSGLLEAAFIRASGVPSGNNSTFHVVYSDATAIKLQSNILDHLYGLFEFVKQKKIDRPAIKAFLDEALTLTWMHCLRTALFFKHEAYSNEAEFRFLQLHAAGPVAAPTVMYRTRPYELVKYREFDWRKAAADGLKTIIVGPAADKAKAVRFAKDCLRAFHPASATTIVLSDVPYRS